MAGIEFSITSIKLALSNADLKEFAAELVNRLLFIGFFYALLLNSGNWLTAIINSFRQTANNASLAAGGSINLSPSDIFDTGLELCFKIVNGVSIFNPIDSLGLFISSIIIIICFAIIAATLLVALCEMYIVVNAGVILLGFGPLRYTSDFAVKYLIYGVSVGVKLFVLQLLVGLGESLILGWEANFTQNDKQILVLVGAAVVMLVLVKEVPSIVAGLINGSSFGSSGMSLSSVTAAVTGALAGAAVGGAGGAKAVYEAAKYADIQQSQGGGGFMGKAVAMGSGLARAAGQDIMGQFSGMPGYSKRGMGWRMSESIRQQGMGLAAQSMGEGAAVSGNTIGPGAPPKETQTPASGAPQSQAGEGDAAHSDRKSRYISPLNNYGQDEP